MDFSARLAGLKILARYSQTGLGFSAWAELRPGLNPSPCNQHFGFQRICYRSRAEISSRLAGLKFQPGMKFVMLSGPKLVVTIPEFISKANTHICNIEFIIDLA